MNTRSARPTAAGGVRLGVSVGHVQRLVPPQGLIKQDNLDAFNEKDPYKPDDSRDEDDDNDDNDNSMETETFPLERDEVMPVPIPHLPAERMSFPKGLPWAPKVRYRCLGPENHPNPLLIGSDNFYVSDVSQRKGHRKFPRIEQK